MIFSAASAALQLVLLISAAYGQQDFSSLQIPTFRLNVFYPRRFNDPLMAERETCRPITDYIDRNSARFNAELVTYTANNINFASSQSRIMSSRMQSRLSNLAGRYNRRMTVLKAWTPFPDPELANEPESLHYEGMHAMIS
jgi:hypothetical protein